MSPTPTFPFGRHRGVPYDQVPVDYLQWALENMKDLRPETRAIIESTLSTLKRAVGGAGSAQSGPQGGGQKAPAKPKETGSHALSCPACGVLLRVRLEEGAGDDSDVPF